MQNPPQPPPESLFSSFFKSDFSCMSAKFSPFNPNRIAISCCDNFGIVGKGKLIILEMIPGQEMKPIRVFEEHDAIFDCSWTEFDENLIISGCGDGEVKLWEINSGKLLFTTHEHKSEVQSVACNHQNTSVFLSSGSDGTARMWDINVQKQIQQFQTHKGCAYQAVWHPVQPSIFATVGADGAMRLWDINAPQSKNIASIRAHQGEVMSCDFNKYEEQIATASNDKTINIWDLRNLKVPINVLSGHRYPIRKIKYSPHDPSILASASYDMMVIIWDTAQVTTPVVKMHHSHTEFVVDVDFSLHVPKLISSCSWDGKCYVWNWDQIQPKV